MLNTGSCILMLATMNEFQMEGFLYNRCSLYQTPEIGIAELLPAIPLSVQTQPVPYFFAADDAFAMRHYIMKSYLFKDETAPNRIFNHRLSRARRIVENVFGLIANRFLVQRKSLIQSPHKHCKYCASSLCSAQFSDVNTRITASYLQVQSGLLTQKVQTLIKYSVVQGEKKRCYQQTCCSYQDDFAPAHVTIKGMISNNFSRLPKGKPFGNINIFDFAVTIHTFVVRQTTCCTILTQFTERNL